MLIEFRAENHRSLREEQVLSFEAAGVASEEDRRPRKIDAHPAHLLPSVAIYGANASGKSNVLEALSFMRSAVLYSHRMWDPDLGVPREPFAWGPQQLAPSLFEVQFVEDGVRYQYGFVADDDGFVEEWLFSWPHGRRQTWFERDKSEFKFGDSFHGENKLVERTTRANALFLSTAIQHAHTQLRPVYQWFRRLAFRMTTRGAIPSGRFGTEAWITDRMRSRGDSEQIRLFSEEQDPELSAFIDFLRIADFGITDVRADPGEKNADRRARRQPRIFVKHQARKGLEEDAWLPLEEESHGTRTLFQLALPILGALREGGVLAVDEIESGLHPLLASYVIDQFNSPESNPLGAQLLFTTHDTNLLSTVQGKPALRRDQVWLTEKDSDGATSLFPLSDFNPRKAENLERGYLQGRYGAIPLLRQLTRISD